MVCGQIGDSILEGFIKRTDKRLEAIEKELKKINSKIAIQDESCYIGKEVYVRDDEAERWVGPYLLEGILVDYRGKSYITPNDVYWEQMTPRKPLCDDILTGHSEDVAYF